MSSFCSRSTVGARTGLHLSTAILAFGLVACALDRSGGTNADGAAASSSASGAAETTTTGATAPGSSGVQSSTADASAGTGGTTDVGGGAGSESASSGGDGGGDGGGGGMGSSSESSASSGGGGAGPDCGNGEPERGEECDDGNDLPGDGCGPTCDVEDPDTCDGAPIALGLGSLTIEATTENADDDFDDTQDVAPCYDDGWEGPDLVYAVTTTAPGKLTARLVPSFDDHYLIIRTSCPGGDDDILACFGDDEDDVEVSTQALVGETYYVVVDSWSDQAGAFTLTLTLTAQ